MSPGVVAMPTETRTAPIARPGHRSCRRSSVSRRPPRKSGPSSAADQPSAASRAPGLQKQPVRSEIRRALAAASTVR